MCKIPGEREFRKTTLTKLLKDAGGLHNLAAQLHYTVAGLDHCLHRYDIEHAHKPRGRKPYAPTASQYIEKRQALMDALSQCEYNQAEYARRLGRTRQRVEQVVKQYGLKKWLKSDGKIAPILPAHLTGL